MSKYYRYVAMGLGLWLMLACGSDPTPTPTPLATPAPPTTIATPATPTPAVAPASTVSAAESVTAAQSLTSSAGITGVDGALTTDPATALNPGAPCALEADLDLAGYPELEQNLGCAVDEANFAAVGINEFGEGPEFNRFMLWLAAEQQIYVLRPEGRWQAYPDTWADDQPTFSCNPLGGEAASPPLPRRGFGKVWCDNPELQQVMGTITREERECQHAVSQRFAQGRLLACYEDATIRYIRLLEDGRWDTVLAR